MFKMESIEQNVGEDEEERPTKALKSVSKGQDSNPGLIRPLKVSNKDLFKAPTPEELNQLKETESLFHCSLLKMQVSWEYE